MRYVLRPVDASKCVCSPTGGAYSAPSDPRRGEGNMEGGWKELGSKRGIKGRGG